MPDTTRIHVLFENGLWVFLKKFAVKSKPLVRK